MRLRPYYTFQDHTNLKKLIYNFSLVPGEITGYFFKGGMSGINNWNSFDWSGYTSLNYVWRGCIEKQCYFLNISINSCTTIAGAFSQSSLFSVIKLTNTSLVENISNAIHYAPSVISFEMDNCAAVINTTDFIYASSNLQQLHKLILNGLTVGINLAYCPLDSVALNNFFTSLGTANGAQTITITGCKGAATCDTSIAIAKGFTIAN